MGMLTKCLFGEVVHVQNDCHFVTNNKYTRIVSAALFCYLHTVFPITSASFCLFSGYIDDTHTNQEKILADHLF